MDDVTQKMENVNIDTSCEKCKTNSSALSDIREFFKAKDKVTCRGCYCRYDAILDEDFYFTSLLSTFLCCNCKTGIIRLEDPGGPIYCAVCTGEKKRKYF